MGRQPVGGGADIDAVSVLRPCRRSRSSRRRRLSARLRSPRKPHRKNLPEASPSMAPGSHITKHDVPLPKMERDDSRGREQKKNFSAGAGLRDGHGRPRLFNAKRRPVASAMGRHRGHLREIPDVIAKTQIVEKARRGRAAAPVPLIDAALSANHHQGCASACCRRSGRGRRPRRAWRARLLRQRHRTQPRRRCQAGRRRHRLYAPGLGAQLTR